MDKLNAGQLVERLQNVESKLPVQVQTTSRVKSETIDICNVEILGDRILIHGTVVMTVHSPENTE